MSKALRIAIYSGNIPSTTFIERLIEGVANSGQKVLLFGVFVNVNFVSYEFSALSNFNP